MKLEAFFQKFDLLADAPNAVAKMREFVLELAVTGTLLPQESADGSASELLSAIEAERMQLVNARKIKARPILPLDDGEVPYELPLSWKWARLSQVGYELGQKIPDQRFTYIDVGAIDPDKGRISDRAEIIEPDEAPSRARKLVVRGTVIYSTVRPYLLNVAIVERGFAPEPIASTAFGILHPFCGISNRYLFYWLRSARFTHYVQAAMKGMAYPAINDEKFYSGYIPVPPAVEQERIVAKLDELMALCDLLEAQQHERQTQRAALASAALARFADAPTLANLDFLFHNDYWIDSADLRRTILSLAVQGNLVPQEITDAPASQSIELVSSEAREAIRAGRIRRHGLDTPADDSEQQELPPGWRWTRLVEITRPVPNALKRGPFGSAIRKDMFVPTGFKVYEQQHAISGDFSRGCYYISHEKFQELKAFELCPGEVVVSCSGTVGKTAIVPLGIERGVINQALLKLSLHQSALLNEYFLILFPAFFMETETLTNLSGTAQKNIPGMEVLKAMPFPLPPLAEQRRIVARVEQLMILVDELEKYLSASRVAAANLLEAVVAELTN